ncbi:uncharacterized protein LOC119769477 [Culex quinquefasciatus]|uniref:uncharacterized protein LOC119769477 n=1 Tax=Culex quinquefasciatus TaxID=7176 RepID=UPI0018E3E09B|nr:uncharacterized protein LOC119769477 [Culex quinquefasciatus]
MENSGCWETFVKSTNFKRKVQQYLSKTRYSEDSQVPDSPEEHEESLQESAFIENAAAAVDDFFVENSGETIDDDAEEPADDAEEPADDAEEPADDSADYSPDEWSDQEDTIEDTEPESLEVFLQRWSLEHKITHSALKPLLDRLSLVDRTLSTDPRRLLGTPRKEPELIQIEGGQYWHHGLEHSLRIAFNKLSNPRNISININIDGLPIFKNGTDQLWPILFNVHEEPTMKPMIIGVYCGRTKPKLIEQFWISLFQNVN